MLTLKVYNSPQPILLTLSMDEMTIRQHLEFDGTRYYGRVDMGNDMDNDSLNTAKQCLVFMAVLVNENWKLPIGYFVLDALKSAQKVELVRHALNLSIPRRGASCCVPVGCHVVMMSRWCDVGREGKPGSGYSRRKKKRKKNTELITTSRNGWVYFSLVVVFTDVSKHERQNNRIIFRNIRN